EPITVGTDRAGEYQRQSLGAVFEILQYLRVGGGGIGMIDPLQHGPGSAGCPAGDRSCPGGARGERRDAKVVVGACHELVERGALEHAFDQLEPLLAGGGGKFGGELEVIAHSRNSCAENATRCEANQSAFGLSR